MLILLARGRAQPAGVELFHLLEAKHSSSVSPRQVSEKYPRQAPAAGLAGREPGFHCSTYRNFIMKIITPNILRWWFSCEYFQSPQPAPLIYFRALFITFKLQPTGLLFWHMLKAGPCQRPTEAAHWAGPGQKHLWLLSALIVFLSWQMTCSILSCTYLLSIYLLYWGVCLRSLAIFKLVVSWWILRILSVCLCFK